MSDRVLLVVSSVVGDGRAEQAGPRKDYAALAEVLGGDILDLARARASPAGRLICRLLGAPVAQAWLAFRARRGYRAIVTDGEHVGIPLALLLKLARACTPLVTIGHRLSAPKKRPFFRWLRVHTHISRIVLHATSQHEAALGLGIPPARLALIPYQVDTSFWRPQPRPVERLILSAGLEFRDYPTLFRAIDGLDVEVVVAAASHWSRRDNSAEWAIPPPNVRIGSFDYRELRDLYARAALVVVPLRDVDFQAGVTTILEAMAMGKAVVVTRTRGQTDMVVDRRVVARSDPARPSPAGLLRTLADRQGESVDCNGLYVPPGDPQALRSAIVDLLDHPAERRQLGAAGRRAVERLMTVDHFARRIRILVERACRDDRRDASPNGAGAASRPTDPGPRVGKGSRR